VSCPLRYSEKPSSERAPSSAYWSLPYLVMMALTCFYVFLFIKKSNKKTYIRVAHVQLLLRDQEALKLLGGELDFGEGLGEGAKELLDILAVLEVLVEL